MHEHFAKIIFPCELSLQLLQGSYMQSLYVP